MITFKQKEYAVPAVLGGTAGAIMAGTSVLGLGVSGASAMKGSKDAEEQKEEMQRHNKQMEKIAKEQGIYEKSFGMINMQSIKGLVDAAKGTNAGGMASDLWKIHGKGIKKAAGFGASMAGLGYVGNRAAQSWKDHDEGNDGNTGKALAKIAGTAAIVSGGIWAAKNGKLGDAAKNFMGKEGMGGKALGSIGKAVNPIVRNEKGEIKKGATLGKVGMNTAFASMPVIGYAAQRSQQKDQVEAQQNFSDNEGKSGVGKKILGGLAVAGTVAGGLYGARRGVFGAGAQKAVGNAMAASGSYLGKYGATKRIGDKLMKSGSDAYGTGMAKQISSKQTAAGFKNWENGGDLYNKMKELHTTSRATEAAKGASLKKGVSEVADKGLSFFGFMGNKTGTKAVQNTADKLINSNSKWSQNVGKLMKENPNAANVAAGAGALAAGSTAFAAGDKAVKAVTKTVDKGAYDIEKEQNQRVYSKITFREKGEKVDKETGLRTKFYKKETKVNKPGFHAKSVEITERSFTKWDQTDQLKDMSDADILAEQKRKTSSLNLGKSVAGAGVGAIGGGLIGKKLGAGGTGALAGAAIGGMAGMDKQTREKTAIGASLGAAAGMGLSLLTKGKISNGAKLGAALGGTAGVISGVASGHKQNKENQFFNDRLEYAQGKAEKREKTDWKNNVNNREGYSR